MVEEMDEEQISEFFEAFCMFDKNRDGQISLHELGAIMCNLGLNPTDEELQELIEGVDKKGDGTIDFPGFLTLISTKLQVSVESAEEMRAAFEIFDLNSAGNISAVELKQVMSSIGETISEEEINDMIREGDADGDGMINYEEFVQMIFKTKKWQTLAMNWR